MIIIWTERWSPNYDGCVLPANPLSLYVSTSLLSLCLQTNLLYDCLLLLLLPLHLPLLECSRYLVKEYTLRATWSGYDDLVLVMNLVQIVVCMLIFASFWLATMR